MYFDRKWQVDAANSIAPQEEVHILPHYANGRRKRLITDLQISSLPVWFTFKATYIVLIYKIPT